MELLCVQTSNDRFLEVGKIYHLDRVVRSMDMVIVSERPTIEYYTYRFVINPPPDATDEMKEELKILWDRLCKMY